jgi:hypothetical protein
MISVKTSGTEAHLCATTAPTPPAPMINTLAIFLFLVFIDETFVYTNQKPAFQMQKYKIFVELLKCLFVDLFDRP